MNKEQTSIECSSFNLDSINLSVDLSGEIVPDSVYSNPALCGSEQAEST